MRKICILFGVMLCLCLVAGCGRNLPNKDTEKVKIVATLFPQYDFARQIAKDKAEVTLLLPPGVESHTFEPTALDIVSINSSDVFLYTGKYMEPWAERIVSGSLGKEVNVTDVSSGIELMHVEHGDEHDDEHDDDGHDHTYDPHIWLDPNLAIKMVDNVTKALCDVDPENETYYRENAANYQSELKRLDDRITHVVQTGKRKSIVFGGRFAHSYFVKRYNLIYKSAFSGCSAESEPSLQSISEIIKFISDNNIPCVYYEEFSEPKVAQSIASQTGAKLLQFTTAHNVTKDQLNDGITFMEVMDKNLENLKIGLD